MEAREIMFKPLMTLARSLVPAVVLSAAALSSGCVVAAGGEDASFEPDGSDAEDDGAWGGGPPSIGPDAVVDCTVALDSVVVRTCKLGAIDKCSVQATVQAAQVVKSTSVVKPVVGTSGTHGGKAVVLLSLAEAKLLANLHHMKLLLGSNGSVASSAYQYAKNGAPFIYAAPIPGMTVVTKASANLTIARVASALAKEASACKQFRVASTDGITPVPTAFICESLPTDQLLFCDGTQPAGIDYAMGPSTIVNGVELAFDKAGCGAFTYGLVNHGDTKVTVKSKISGVKLQPLCDFGVAASGGTGYCSAKGIAGPETLIYSGTVTRGSVTRSFNLPVVVRCTSP